MVPEVPQVLAGCEDADSIVMNPHKWLFTPLDCSALYVRDPDALQRSFSLVPEYLKSREEDVTNYMDWGTWLGRRFRALKLWMVIRHFGHEGLAARIRRHIELAQDLVQRIDADPDIEALAPAPFSTVCFRFRPSELKELSGDARRRQACDEYLDRLNEAVLDAVNASGEAFLSHTKIRERYAIRRPSAILAAIGLRSTGHGGCCATKPRVWMAKCARNGSRRRGFHERRYRLSRSILLGAWRTISKAM